jgi:hypothetical protein
LTCEEIILFSSIVIFVPACTISCFPLTCICNEDNPLPISTLFIIALLAIIESLAKILPATSNASVAVELSPILNPLSVMLCKTFPACKSNCFFPFKRQAPVFLL